MDNTTPPTDDRVARAGTRRPWPARGCGLGQLSLVEHALCPLDARASLRTNLVFEAGYQFTDAGRRRRTARATVLSPLGLSAGDEFYLWGLLALTFAQRDPDPDFHATPHFCLRQLGVIDKDARRGGRQYRQFAAAVERLSAVTYRNDHFYDPVRAEHRRVSFGFFSYSLPLDAASDRAWRIAWDPVFFEFVAAGGGHLRFDLATYREFDPAARRLFLFASKVFARRETTPRLDLRHLGERVLGFSAGVRTPDLKQKVRRVVARLAEAGVFTPGEPEFRKEGKGAYSVTLARGPYFTRTAADPGPAAESESPLFEPLVALGFEPAAAVRLLRRYPHAALREWTDITLAAKERYGSGFFSRSPQAYLVDNVRAAAGGGRTPPDWWHDVRKAEHARANRRVVDALAGAEAPDSDAAALAADSHELLDRVRTEFFQHFRAGGHSEAGARGMAHRHAREHVARRTSATGRGFTKLDSLIRTLPRKH